MDEIKDRLKFLADQKPYKMIISKPLLRDAAYRKIVLEKKETFYQAAAFTKTQVFHQNIPPEELFAYLEQSVEGVYLQVNAWQDDFEHMLLISKKGKVTFKSKAADQTASAMEAKGAAERASHNRRKKYLLEEGAVIEPLADMGIFTSEGKIVNAMYDKFRQINRFLEIIEDGLKSYPYDHLNIIDFGCGKSYLTFILYYYLTEIRKRKVRIVGLDLKKEVILKCNAAAEKYGYRNLHFEVGDINGYEADFPVDMVVTLHACDTATDYALFHAVRWGAKMIFSVPCCQHELNSQIRTADFSLLTRYGILKERFSALATDAIRGNLLEYCGYRTQLLEFVDLAHTPKNILIRAVQKKAAPASVRRSYLEEVERMMKEFHFKPALYELLKEDGRIMETD